MKTHSIHFSFFASMVLLLSFSACAQDLKDSLSNHKQGAAGAKANDKAKSGRSERPMNAPTTAEIKRREELQNEQGAGSVFSVELLPERILPSHHQGIGPELDDVVVLEHAPTPPIRHVRVKLSIQNRHQQAMWYLLPAQGEVELLADGRFRTEQAQTAFLGREYMGFHSEESERAARLVECHFRGDYKQSFKAFYVPAQSSIVLRNYTLEVWGELKEIELWGVPTLLVNGKKPLQDWLPYSVLSDAGKICVQCPEEENCTGRELVCDPLNARACAEAVQFVDAHDFKKYRIALP